MRTALGKGAGDPIQESDLVGLRQLDWSYEKREEAGASWSDRISDLTGLEFATKLTRLHLGDNGIGDLAPLGHLPKLTALDVNGSDVSSVAPLAHLRNLRELDLRATQVSDIAPLGGLASLEKLYLDNNRIGSISAVSRLSNLLELRLSHNEIKNLEPLRSLRKLRYAYLGGNPISSLVPLARLTRLQILQLNDVGVSEVSSLSRLTNLVHLELSGNGISDISPLESLTTCGFLVLDGNAITDVSALADFAELSSISLRDNQISDLTPLSDLTRLWRLRLGGNFISRLDGLANLTRLTELDLARNAVTDLTPLAGLTLLNRLDLSDNGISDVNPLRTLIGLTWLDLSGNLLTDITPLSSLRGLNRLWLADNAISDVAPLADAERLAEIDLANNMVADLAALASVSTLRRLYVQGNPLSEESVAEHVPAFRNRGIAVANAALTISDVSVKEGEAFETAVRLSEPVAEDVVGLAYRGHVAAGTGVGLATGDDFDYFGGRLVTIPAGSSDTLVAGRAARDSLQEPHETFNVSFSAESAPTGVVVSSRGRQYRVPGPRVTQARGLLVDESGPFHAVPLVAPADHRTRQGFVRVVNRGADRLVHLEALDPIGNSYPPGTLSIGKGQTTHFNSDDLEDGNAGKGLSGGVGAGSGDWRLKLWSESLSVLTYMRTSDGFLTSLHDVVPPTSDGYWVPIFNPGSNLDQVSILRLINDGAETATVEISGLDDSGVSPGDVVQLSLEPGETRSVTARELEAGTGLQGALGDGDGKWQLMVASDRPVAVASLLESPTGHLTNLSTIPAISQAGRDDTVHFVPLFPAASDQHGRQGFLRVINPGTEELVAGIVARDDTEREFTPVSLAVRPGAVQQFNSDDLELGNASKGLSAGVGSGDGDWRLEVTTPSDIVVLAYIRTSDGFLTSMHDVAPLSEDGYVVPIFNPASNVDQVSRLRIVNPGDAEATVTVTGIDDRGVVRGPVGFSIAGSSVRDFSSQELESGGAELDGQLGDGFGKWRLVVSSDESVQVMSLLQSPTGHLTNLSSSPEPW